MSAQDLAQRPLGFVPKFEPGIGWSPSGETSQVPIETISSRGWNSSETHNWCQYHLGDHGLIGSDPCDPCPRKRSAKGEGLEGTISLYGNLVVVHPTWSQMDIWIQQLNWQIAWLNKSQVKQLEMKKLENTSKIFQEPQTTNNWLNRHRTRFCI